MQIIMKATTSGANAAGAVITTAAVQVLPAWAPPIHYISTTAPFLAILRKGTTGNVETTFLKVRAYGRRSGLHSGAECVSLNSAVNGGVATKKSILTLTYRSLGEIARP